MEKDIKKLRMASGKAVAKAWREPNFRDLLIQDPKLALASIGYDVPEELTIRVLEDTTEVTHQVERMLD